MRFGFSTTNVKEIVRLQVSAVQLLRLRVCRPRLHSVDEDWANASNEPEYIIVTKQVCLRIKEVPNGVGRSCHLISESMLSNRGITQRLRQALT